MNRLLALVALVFLALAPQRVGADPADIAAASRSVVRVVLITHTSDGVALVGHGSGFAVAPDLVLTNAHVVAPLAEDSSMKAGIVPSQGSSGYFAKVVAFSPRNDLALLRLAEKGSLVPATLFTGAVTDGEDVYAVGYPDNVDHAQGLNPSDLMSPTAPVKTRGAVSAGRTSKGFETILHTAPLGSGNSGGPLLDACGRVIGTNSFGTVSDSGADSEFYFAASMREISRFLLKAGVSARTTGEPCRSLADLDAAERERLAGVKALSDSQQQAEAQKRAAQLQSATRRAEMEVITARENHLALAGIALLLAMAAGGAALWLSHQGQKQKSKAAAAAAVLLLVLAPVAWFTRPSIAGIDSRAREIVAEANDAATAAPATQAAPGEGTFACVFNPQRSRVTVSDTADVPLTWRPDGCVNERTQYGLAVDGWSKMLAPQSDDTVTVASYDPATRTYREDRYLLDLATMEKIRADRTKNPAPSCGADEAAARKLGEAQASARALLPAAPNERLVYDCRPANPALP